MKEPANLFIIKTIQEFVFFFSIMFFLHYLRKLFIAQGGKKYKTEYYFVMLLLVINVIVNTTKVITFIKHILKENCGFNKNENENTIVKL